MSTLFAFSKGSRVRIHHCEDNLPLKRRLEALGIIPGEEIAIVKNDGVMPIIILVKGAKVMIGRSVGRSIYAEATDAGGFTNATGADSTRVAG